ncbi:ROK family protein [Tautonia sociabilis]|uniref:ROK family protein n=1 Tax=Tautonia sociabilis TaxID=2080755 RepID=A0A432MJ53_9BACT|nr:ROK family protein [Tautonia sociabilis]RUL87391.1 ROK family protein [Tautonia sociabilis]
MAKPLLLGVEIGGTKLQAALGHGDETILQQRRATVDLAAGAEGIRAQLLELVDHCCWSLNLTRTAIEAVGVGFGGPIDSSRGVITTSHHVPGWDGFPLADWLRRELGVEAVSIENDADTAGLGEARFGAGKGKDPLLYVTIGSGVGGGLILGGRIHRGTGLGAAEIGHLWVTPPDDNGLGGQTVEQAASGWSIGRSARQAVAESLPDAETLSDLVDGDPEQVSAEVVAMAAGLGDTASKAILDHATRSLAAGLAHAVTLLGPSRIILGGGVSMIGEDLWFDPIRRRLNRLAFPPFLGSFDVVPAALGEAVVLLGGLALAKDAWTAARSASS